MKSDELIVLLLGMAMLGLVAVIALKPAPQPVQQQPQNPGAAIGQLLGGALGAII